MLIYESHDDKGNPIEYVYKPEDLSGVDRAQANERNRTAGANRYPNHIYYGNRYAAGSRPADSSFVEVDGQF